MKNASCLSLLSALLFLTLASGARAATDKYRLSWRDDPATTMVVGWNQVSGSQATVHYGPTDHGDNAQAYPFRHAADVIRNYRGMSNHFARLEGLKPDRPYYFVIQDSEGISKRFWFRTAPDEPQPFTFVAGGDTRTNAQPRRDGNHLVSCLRPLFVLHGGDYMGSGTPEQWAEWFDDWQLSTSKDGRMYPLVCTHGNHENADLQMIHKLFDTPRADMYYALDVAGKLLRVYILNTETDRKWPSVWKAQKTWLDADLGRNYDRIWTLASYHRPMRPHTSAKAEGLSQIQAWAEIFFQHGVDLVIESDTHMVKRTFPLRPYDGPGSHESFIRDDRWGTVYIGEGSWGAPRRPADDNKPWTLASDSFWQFKWIQVTPEQLRVHAVKIENIDRVTPNEEARRQELPAGITLWEPPTGTVLELDRRPKRTPNAPRPPAVPELIQQGSEWQYFYTGGLPGENWNTLPFDASSWARGRAPLGYGDEGLRTTLSFGNNPELKPVTAYFRHSFHVDETLIQGGFTLWVQRDDGVAVYLNGKEVARDNLPQEALSARTRAEDAAAGAGETRWISFNLSGKLLKPGANLIAAEVHQHHPSSSDLRFDLEFKAKQ